MGRAPRDFSAPKRAAGCSSYAWGRAPCRWSRARMIRGLTPAIFPLPRTVFPSPRAIGVRPEALFGAQKPLGARLKRRKILQLRQKTGFLPFFHHENSHWGLRRPGNVFRQSKFALGQPVLPARTGRPRLSPVVVGAQHLAVSAISRADVRAIRLSGFGSARTTSSIICSLEFPAGASSPKILI